MPAFTVIIPTYNWAAVLPYSIGSVLRQSFSDFELLVVGDGCSDGSEQAVASFDDPRVRWINLPKNTGNQVGPNNEGNKQAAGKYVAYLGHDDLWMTGHLEALYGAFESGADFAYTGTIMVMGEDLPPTPFCIRQRLPNVWLPPTSFAHTRKLFDTIGGWKDFRQLRCDPETDILNRVQESGASLQFVPRMTAIKLPAARRKDVYKTKPHHEQKLWFERLVNEPDLESTIATEMLTVLSFDIERRPYGKLVSDLISVTHSRITKRFARKITDPASYKSIVVDKRRSYKGLDPLD